MIDATEAARRLGCAVPVWVTLGAWSEAVSCDRLSGTLEEEHARLDNLLATAAHSSRGLLLSSRENPCGFISDHIPNIRGADRIDPTDMAIYLEHDQERGLIAVIDHAGGGRRPMSGQEHDDDQADGPRPITVQTAAEAARRCADLIENAAKMLAGAELGLGGWTEEIARRLSHDGTVDAKAVMQNAIDERRARIAKVAEDITARSAAWLKELEECDEDAADLNWEANAEAE